MKRLGRVKKVDERDHLLTAVRPKLRVKYWESKWSGNQGVTPSCVGFAWVHFLESEPKTYPPPHPIVDPYDVYKLAQRLDETPGENYEGTTVRGGAKALKQLGFLKGYAFTTSVQVVIDAVLTKGPIVLGTNWYRGMNYPIRNVIQMSGALDGGHAYILDGVDTINFNFRMKNSWGYLWGDNGHAEISFKKVEQLLKEGGEACQGTEN